MNDKENLENTARIIFSFLNQKGFHHHNTIQDVWISSLLFINTTIELGIQIDLDWRDLVVSVMIVRLENGHLPKGYYVSNGKRCRVYLQELVQLYKWLVPEDSWKRIKPSAKHYKLKISDIHAYEKMLESHKDVLEACIQEITGRGVTLFDNVE